MQTLSLFNWSLKKTLASTSDPILKAQIIIFLWIFILNFFKVGAVLPGYLADGKSELITACVIVILVTVLAIKFLLSRPNHLPGVIHFALGVSIAFMWPKVFTDDYSLSLLNIQDVFMICMWSFYGLSSGWGLFYSILAIGTLSIGMFMHGSITLTLGWPGASMEGTIAILFINTVIILLGHYYYRNAIYNTMSEKEKLNDELEESNEAKTLFLSTMSHELRTPLNSVIGMANLLIEDNKDKEQKENLDILKFSAESLLTLINDILDFNKMGSGKVQLELIPFNLKELLENACAGLRIKAIEKDLYCKLSIDPNFGDQYITGDPTRLLQIVYNLIGNGIKFTKHGGVELKVELLKREGSLLSLRFTVQDTGLGISAQQQKHIFEPFAQASRNTTRKYGGTGLGLSIVKHLLTLHHSEIHLESEINAGARFYFDIDYPVAVLELTATPVATATEDTTDISGLRVLLAEDNLMSILFMKKLFSKWNISLKVAEHGEEVLSLLNEQDYDVILMDVHMPVMNGYEATRKIRALEDEAKANVYIIALTASVSDDVRSSVMAVGMNDSVSKPFQSNELLEKLKQIKSASLQLGL